MSVTVRPAGIDDVALLMEWRMRVLREVFPGDWGAEEARIRENNASYYRRHLPDGTHVACFAEDAGSGRAVGCGGICYQEEMPSPDNPSGTCGYLMNIYTVPERRGEGIGRRIVEFLIADAMSRGTGKIYLESSADGKPLYRELGFKDMVDYMKLARL